LVSEVGKSFILSVGVNSYQSDTIPDLSWAAADAWAFHEASVRGRDPRLVESRLLIDDQATTLAVREAIGDWLATAGRDDNVLAFFAGHGAREVRPGADIRTETEAYLLPVDADIDHLYSTGISLTHELPVVLKRMAAGNVTLIFDCCLSGSGRAFNDGVRPRGIDGPNFARMLAVSDVMLNAAVMLYGGGLQDIGEGVSILMACGPNQAALESDELGHGIFTHHLLLVLEEQKRQASAMVSLGEVYAKVVKLVVDHTNADQVPMLEGRLADQHLFVGA
jgi:uncharacterized caspase-like protein